MKQMNLLVVSDIFGRTTCLENLVNYLTDSQIEANILDPYKNQYRYFENEEEAYRTFRSEVGLDKYIKALREAVANIISTPTVILGFSVGASAIWALSESMENDDLLKGICFYSSQIRHYLDVVPKIDIELYFAESESSYDVDTIAAYISNTQRVRCIKTMYRHGFMNEKSNNFDKKGHALYRKIIKNGIASHLTRTRKLIE